MTYEELKNNANDAKERLQHLKTYLKIDNEYATKNKIEELMLAPDFWENKEKSQESVAKLSIAKNIIGSYETLAKEVDDFIAFAELTLEASDDSILSEADKLWSDLVLHLEKTEIISFLSGQYDRNAAYFSIHAGAGGTESCDWTAMLLRMYRRWFEGRGWQEEIIDFQPGDEAGVKSVTVLVKGEFVYGYAKAERGVHRLVRISPFDSNARRHTSFASVDVMPEIEDDESGIEINENDLKVDTYRSSGAGGQHVNKTDSAVRITHLPSGIIVACQAERSQHKNRAKAMKMLKAKLYAIKEEERRKEQANLAGEKTDMGWGNQIRSYVLHPYQMVKDLRTAVETGNTGAVLDGDLDQFVNAWIKLPK